MDACARLARSWRNSRDDRDSYLAAANKAEQEFSLGQLAFDPKSLVGIETFRAVERTLLHYVEAELLEKARPDLLRFATTRLSRFWAEVIPAVQARWALIAAAAEVLLEADRVVKEIKHAPASVPAFVKAYAEGDEPWCLLDTHHRHMENRKYNFEFESGGEHQGLDASYGFEDATGEVKLKVAGQEAKQIEPNTITLMIAEDIAQKTVGVYLLDATAGAELATPLTVEVAIAM